MSKLDTTVYITRYALTLGIYKMKGRYVRPPRIGPYGFEVFRELNVHWKVPDSWFGLYTEHEFSETLEEAEDRVREMREIQIQMMKIKLKALRQADCLKVTDISEIP